MPETTENYHHIPVRDKSGFVDDSMRTITISEDEGIKAVIGKLTSDPRGSTHVQKYLFDADKWTMERAEKWVEAHKTQESRVRESREIECLEATRDALAASKVDQETGIIHDVKLLGRLSRRQDGSVFHEYTPMAMQEVAAQLKGVNWYLDHPPKSDPDKVRNMQDLGGKVLDARVVENEGVFGDLKVAAPKTRNKWVLDTAESAPECVGMSINGLVFKEREGNPPRVVGAKRIRSVDMVTDPGTVLSLFEEKHPEQITEEKTKEVNEMSEELVQEFKTKIEKLTTQVEAQEKELKAVREAKDKLEVAETGRQKREMALRVLEACKVPVEIRSQVLMESLVSAADEAAMKKIAEDRLEIWRKAAKPTSHERPVLESLHDELTPEQRKSEVNRVFELIRA